VQRKIRGENQKCEEDIARWKHAQGRFAVDVLLLGARARFPLVNALLTASEYLSIYSTTTL
jgi:hypothetical protein